MAGSIGLGTLTGTVGVVRTAEAKKGAASQGGQGRIGTMVVSTVFVVLGAMLVWV